MEKLKWTNLQQTPIVLQMADQSIIKLEGILEDVVISIDFGSIQHILWFFATKIQPWGLPLDLRKAMDSYS
jgi:hypothetical protein